MTTTTRTTAGQPAIYWSTNGTTQGTAFNLQFFGGSMQEFRIVSSDPLPAWWSDVVRLSEQTAFEFLRDEPDLYE